MSYSPTEGYPKLAGHMGSCPDSSIFRRFGSLNSKNLLYLQAELTHLEEELHALEEVDSRSKEGNASDYSKDWYWLDNSVQEDNGQQLETVLKIREKLKIYSREGASVVLFLSVKSTTDLFGLDEAVIQQATLLGLSPPRDHDLQSLRDWLQRPEMGNYHLIGADRKTWGDLDDPIDPNTDLITLVQSPNNDIFTHWFFEKVLPIFHHLRLRGSRSKEKDLESGIVRYKEESIHRCTSVVTTIIASLLPTVAIIVLFCVESMRVRLGLIAVFTTLFTTCLALFTSGRRGEIFAAASAFAAVQVVFISTQQWET